MATAIRLTTEPPDVEPVAHPTQPGVCLAVGTGGCTAVSSLWHSGWRPRQRDDVVATYEIAVPYAVVAPR